MKGRWLNLPAMAIAGWCAILVLASPLVPVVRTSLVQPSFYIAAAVAALLFLRMLFDPKCRRGIVAANSEMRGSQTGRSWGPSFFDPSWGLFGSRLGSRALLGLRAILLVELILAALTNRGARHDVPLLAFTGLMIVTLLGLIHLGLNTPVEDR
jgi:hypothetical protein